MSLKTKIHLHPAFADRRGHCHRRRGRQPSAAKKLSHGEVAAIAGIGGFVLGAAIADANRGAIL